MEAVENTDHNVPFGWSGERLTIADQKTSVHRYFVRVEGNGAELEQAAAAAFGGGQIVKLENLTDEFALLTGEMSEAAYADCAAAFEKTAKIRQSSKIKYQKSIENARQHPLMLSGILPEIRLQTAYCAVVPMWFRIS